MVSTPVLRAAYFSLCESHLRYCVTIWGSSSGCDRIFGLQRRAVRVLGGLKYREDCTEIKKKTEYSHIPMYFHT